MSASHDSVEMAMFVGEVIVDGLFVGRCIWHTKEMVGDDIFDTLLISNFEIKLLKEEDPTDESGLRILLEHKVSNH